MEEIVQLAKDRGLDAICITDHNSMGLREYAREYTERTGFPIFVGIVIGGGTIVTGIEINYETNYYMLMPDEYPVVIKEKYREGECEGEVFQIMEDGEAYRLGGFFTENGYRDSNSYGFEEYEGGIKVYFGYAKGLRGCVERDWIE